MIATDIQAGAVSTPSLARPFYCVVDTTGKSTPYHRILHKESLNPQSPLISIAFASYCFHPPIAASVSVGLCFRHGET